MATTKGKKAKVRRPRIKIEYNTVAQVMEEKGIIVQEMADLLKTNPGLVSRIINQKRPCISLPLALRIGQILGMPVEQLFFLPQN